MKIEKVKKLVANLQNNIIYVIHIKNLRRASNHGLVLRKVHKGIKFNQNLWFIPSINTGLKK